MALPASLGPTHPGFVSVLAPWASLPLRIRLAAPLGDDELYEVCVKNRELKIERTAGGELIVMSPTGTETGRRNAELTTQLGTWSKRDGTGVHFDSSTGFLLPNGAERSPDAAWITKSRWEAIPQQERERFARICPDFVVEIASPSDAVEDLAMKMDEWIANGARLGWLIVPAERRAGVWRPNRAAEWLVEATTLAGAPVLHGFVLELAEIW